MIDYNVVGPSVTWRLVHDGQRVIFLGKSGGYTKSLHTIFETSTEAECLAEVARLELDGEIDFGSGEPN